MSNAINQAQAKGFQSNPQQTKQQAQHQQPQVSTNSKAGKIVKPVAIPALQALEHQLDTQKDNLKESARLLVQSKMAETQSEVRDVVADELASIASDDDFFGFGLMFGSPSIPTFDQPTEEPPAEQTIEVPAVNAG